MSTQWSRPLKILIAAMGGEGGGVLSKWLVDVAEGQDFLVQYTYIPGVAQRTGATTYYLEIFPKSALPEDGRQPIRALMPCPGDVDVFLATEIVEAGRALQNGIITADRTQVITSTARTYSVAEKIGMGDERIAPEEIITALESHTKAYHRFNMSACAEEAGSIINAVIFGALAASEFLPFPKSAFESAVRAGRSADSNMRGFDLGYAIVAGDRDETVTGDSSKSELIKSAAALHARMEQDFPSATHEMLALGLEKVAGFQDQDYAQTYLQRAEQILRADEASEGGDRGYELTREGGRWLSRLMAYDDVIRVADLKTRPSRFDRVHSEVRAEDGQIVRVTDFMKPRAEEIANALPAWLGRMIMVVLGRSRLGQNGMRLKLSTTSIFGFSMMWMLGKMKPMRRKTQRFAEEQQAVTDWLDHVCQAAASDYHLALEIVACARLVKGYGPTHCRGTENLETILTHATGPDAADRVRRLREAALADEDGKALALEMDAGEVMSQVAAE